MGEAADAKAPKICWFVKIGLKTGKKAKDLWMLQEMKKTWL